MGVIEINTENIPFTDVEKLAQPMEAPYNDTLRGELGFSRYRMDKILKDYAGFSSNFRIHAFFEHGILYTDYCGGAFRAHEYLPSVVASKYRVSVLEKQKSFHGAYAIGPYIHYANSLLSDEEIKKEKERLGRNLLVFPSHSIDGAISRFNFNDFCSKIHEIAKDFDSVRISLYFKDILLGRHIPYEKEGFEVVTAGHLFDENFLPRQKSLILTSDVTMANDIGTHVGYSIYLNRPHFLIDQKVLHDSEGEGSYSEAIKRNTDIASKIREESDNTYKIKQLFSEYNDTVSKDQKESIGYLWGFDEVKSRDELKELLLNINKGYSSMKYFASGLIRLKEIIKNGRGV